MSEKIKETPEQKFSAQSLSMAMLGLQKQKSTSVEVQEVLKAITLRMDNLDGQAIGNCLYSLQKMTSDDEGVLIFLSKLAPRILTSTASTAPNSQYFKPPVSIFPNPALHASKLGGSIFPKPATRASNPVGGLYL